MRERGIDYFENSRRATYVQQRVRDPQPAGVRGLRRTLLGDHGQRRPGLGERDGQRRRAALLRLHRPRRAVRARRRHDRPVGRGRLAAVRAGDRAADRSGTSTGWTWHDRPVRLQGDVQPDVHGRGAATGGWVSPYHFGIDQGPIVLMIENYRTGLLWDLMRRCPLHRRGTAPGGFPRRLAGGRQRDSRLMAAAPIHRTTTSRPSDRFPAARGRAHGASGTSG